MRTPPQRFIFPAISVIIPVYNAEKYIGDCLDSILNQTFQNFEVIVVDDCSTDKSMEVVKSYESKFGGRLRIEQTLKNLNAPGFPRNKGLYLSHGEYISFLDADDTITPTALEELYSVAKDFDADVVACEKYYNVPDQFFNDEEFKRQLQPFSWHMGPFVDKPTQLNDNILERLSLCNQKKFLWNSWSKLIRRDLIFQNEFGFSDATIAEDVVFTICLLCTAKKYILVPNVINYYRVREGSVSYNEEFGNEKFFRKYIKAFATAFRYLDKFLSDKEFLKQNPQVKYLIFDICWKELLMGYFFPMYDQTPPHNFDKVLMEELSTGDNLALGAFTFNMGAFYGLQLFKAQQYIATLENELQNRR